MTNSLICAEYRIGSLAMIDVGVASNQSIT